MTRKEAIKEYKERKIPQGVFAVRCAATGRVWVGSSLNIDATRNSTWFQLRLGLHRERSLQQEWNEHGEPAFQYEVLEKLKDDVLPMSVKDLLKEKLAHWAGQLGARTF
jgi:hypothetical protein